MKENIVYCILMLILAVSSYAQSDSTSGAPECIRLMEQDVKPGRWVKLTAAEGHSLEGYLAGISYESSTISIVSKESTVYIKNTCSFGDVEQISYYTRGNVKAVYILGGLLGGAFIGAFIGGAVGGDSKEMFGTMDAMFTGMGIGAATGLTLGLVASAGSKKLITINCDF